MPHNDKMDQDNEGAFGWWSSSPAFVELKVFRIEFAFAMRTICCGIIIEKINAIKIIILGLIESEKEGCS